ncbi:hypothetical protein CRUP_037483, partial [Coryphaenoides rupestris]
HDGTDSPADAGDVVYTSLLWNPCLLSLARQRWDDSPCRTPERWSARLNHFLIKKAEKINEDLLSESTESRGLWDSIARIMMLSVLRHTETPVKFWFLKNYLSPSFKESIPHMAEFYGFQYELVQYVWPRWLHQQTEKQRLIWGYKILFLDIVRADLKELRDLPLDGAPYGYTPFCDSRREMDGYRFWKSGYWASHLAHRKYHI